MPDWVSHILLGLIIAEILNVDKKSLVVLGSILPDIVLKAYTLSILAPMPLTFLFWFFYPLHTIAGIILFSLLVSLLFKYNQKKTFLLIFIGALSHIFIDMATKPMEYNIQGMLFFPFSWKAYSFGLFYSEQYWVVALILLVVYITTRRLLKKYRLAKQD